MLPKHASVQATRLGIDAIQDGVVALSGGEYRAVLEVSGTASPLADDAHEIVVRATPVDLSRYVTSLEERGRQLVGGQLAALAHDHAAYVQGLARQRTLLERRFYVVVPAETPARAGWAALLPGARARDEAEPRREAARSQLAFRCDDVGRQLGRCGLTARRLADLELAQLYLACWSPERARAQRFRQQLDDYTTLAVRAAQPELVTE